MVDLLFIAIFGHYDLGFQIEDYREQACEARYLDASAKLAAKTIIYRRRLLMGARSKAQGLVNLLLVAKGTTALPGCWTSRTIPSLDSSL